MKQGIGIVLIGLLVAPLVVAGSGLRATESDETVFLMVELVDPSMRGAGPNSLELRRAVREVRKISQRAPREYLANGERKRARDMRRWRVVEVEAGEAGELIAELENNPAVVSVHEEKLYQTARIPNDPQFSEQIGLDNATWPLDINAPEAWDTTTGSASTVIAIIDGGVDLEHEDLKDHNC